MLCLPNILILIANHLDYLSLANFRIVPGIYTIFKNENFIDKLMYSRYGVRNGYGYYTKTIDEMEYILKLPNKHFIEQSKQIKGIDISILINRRIVTINNYLISAGKYQSNEKLNELLKNCHNVEGKKLTVDCNKEQQYILSYFYGYYDYDLNFLNFVYSMPKLMRLPIHLSYYDHCIIDGPMEAIFDYLVNSTKISLKAYINCLKKLEQDQNQLNKFLNNKSIWDSKHYILKMLLDGQNDKTMELLYNHKNIVEYGEYVCSRVLNNIDYRNFDCLQWLLNDISKYENLYKGIIRLLKKTNLGEEKTFDMWLEFILYNCPSLLDDEKYLMELKEYEKYDIILMLKDEGFRFGYIDETIFEKDELVKNKKPTCQIL